MDSAAEWGNLQGPSGHVRYLADAAARQRILLTQIIYNTGKCSAAPPLDFKSTNQKCTGAESCQVLVRLYAHRLASYGKVSIKMRYAILPVHRFALPNVQPLALWHTLNTGGITCYVPTPLATAIVLAGVFGLIGSASAKHQHQAGHVPLGNKLHT